MRIGTEVTRGGVDRLPARLRRIVGYRHRRDGAAGIVARTAFAAITTVTIARATATLVAIATRSGGFASGDECFAPGRDVHGADGIRTARHGCERRRSIVAIGRCCGATFGSRSPVGTSFAAPVFRFDARTAFFGRDTFDIGGRRGIAVLRRCGRTRVARRVHAALPPIAGVTFALAFVLRLLRTFAFAAFHALCALRTVGAFATVPAIAAAPTARCTFGRRRHRFAGRCRRHRRSAFDDGAFGQFAQRGTNLAFDGAGTACATAISVTWGAGFAGLTGFADLCFTRLPGLAGFPGFAGFANRALAVGADFTACFDRVATFAIAAFASTSAAALAVPAASFASSFATSFATSAAALFSVTCGALLALATAAISVASTFAASGLGRFHGCDRRRRGGRGCRCGGAEAEEALDECEEAGFGRCRGCGRCPCGHGRAGGGGR